MAREGTPGSPFWVVVRSRRRRHGGVLELGVTLVAHSPTGHGVLHRSTDTPLGAALADVARTHGASPGQVALAWVHQQGRRHDHPVVPLPGTTSVAHLQANLAAADLRLADAELARLEVAR